MSIFSSVGHFFEHLFKFLRPGLEKFLQRYKQLALVEIQQLVTLNPNKSFHDWRDEAFENVKAQVLKDEKEIKDNWITIVIALAYEEIKGEMEKKKA